jgi:hypothetical protein
VSRIAGERKRRRQGTGISDSRGLWMVRRPVMEVGLELELGKSEDLGFESGDGALRSGVLSSTADSSWSMTKLSGLQIPT